jgi:hypothetical protein
MVAEFEFKGVDDAYKLLSMLTNNSNTSNNAIVGYNSNIQNNVYYNMVNTTSNNEIDDTPDWIKPWIADIKFTWDPDKRWRELGLKPFDDTKPRPWGYFKQYVLRIENDFKNYVKFDTSKFADDFKYKVAREAYKLRADFPYEHEITYDSNRYWVGVIEKAYKDGSDELVGININADSGSGFFIYNPKDWYDWFLIVVRFGYNYERNEPTLIGIGPYNKEDETKRLTLAKECKRYYFAILNKDFKTAEDAWRQISETYRKYDTENTWLDMTGTYGLVLKYAIEMDRRNIPYPTTVKRSPI